MWKKITIQLFLLLLVFFLIFFAYSFYLKPKNIETVKQTNEDKVLDLEDSETINESNLIKSLKYVSVDNLGNEYLIESKYSELDLKNPDIIFMKNVKAKITMLNSEAIYVTSERAIYNNKNYETSFTGNVTINYIDNKMTCNRFDISIENNFAMVTNDVIFENLKTKLIADRIEIDLITKNSKIFMLDENKKVKIINK